MHTVLFTLSAPLQRWSVSSSANRRDTQMRPTKSGVIGLVANALGRKRDDPIDDLAEALFSCRTETTGHLVNDYQTAGGGSIPRISGVGPERYSVASGPTLEQDLLGEHVNVTWDGKKSSTSVSRVQYLADAQFTVSLSFDDQEMAYEVTKALSNPARQLYLGRKHCIAEPLNPDIFEESNHGDWVSTLPARGADPLMYAVIEVTQRPSGVKVLRTMEGPVSFDPSIEKRNHPVWYLETTVISEIDGSNSQESGDGTLEDEILGTDDSEQEMDDLERLILGDPGQQGELF